MANKPAENQQATNTPAPLGDGGPAFPVQESVVSDSIVGVPAASGMSLRDYLAAKAMAALVTVENPEPAAKQAYQYADAMLAARKAVRQ